MPRPLRPRLTVDYGELEDARWFERGWLLAHRDDDNFRLPRRDLIARRLIEDWLAGSAPESLSRQALAWSKGRPIA